jgi:hypothetical protein
VRFRTVAEAAAHWNGAQQPRRIREEREGADQENGAQDVEPAEVTRPRVGLVEESKHGRILRRSQKKTDSPRSSKILLPGSWNQVARVREGVGERPFPIQSADSSKLKYECGFGPAELASSKAKVNILKHLPNYPPIFTLAEPVHHRMRGRVSNDEM